MSNKPKLIVPYSGQGSILGLEAVEAVSRILQQDTPAYGPMRDKFEAEFATYIGVKYAYTTSNRTTVLFLSVQLLGLNADDEEIVRILIEEEGVGMSNRYFPIHLLPEVWAQGYEFGECPVAEKVCFEQQINLPIYPTMTTEQVDYLIAAVGRAIHKVRGE